jgi:hypothetical protein
MARQRRGPGHIDLEEKLLPWFTDALAGTHDLVAELGGHSDFRLRVCLEIAGRSIFDAPNIGSSSLR